MKSIKVIIEETISQEFEVQVSEDSKYPLEDALKIAQEKYKNGEFIVDNGVLIEKQMTATDINNSTEWIKF